MDYITPKRRQGLYLVYKRFFTADLGDYMVPTTFLQEPEKSVDRVSTSTTAGLYKIFLYNAYQEGSSWRNEICLLLCSSNDSHDIIN